MAHLAYSALFATFLIVASSAASLNTVADASSNKEIAPLTIYDSLVADCAVIGAYEGDACLASDDCNQCGFCDEYLRCDNATSVWVREDCGLKPGVDANGIILVSDKLFWNQKSNKHGGICDFWTNLPSDLSDSYKANEKCKPICEFQADNACVRRYTYKDPSWQNDQWSVPAVTLMCPEKTKWNNAILTCEFCMETENCDANC